MMKIKKTILFTLAFLMTPAWADESQNKDGNALMLDKNLSLFAKWYPGIYDNYNQVNFETNGYSGPPPKYPHGRIPQIIHRIENSKLGKYVFYQQQYADGEYEKVYRQRIFIMTPDYEAQGIRQKTFDFKNREAFIDAHLSPGKLENLSSDDLVSLFGEGCSTVWRKQGDQFKGDIEKGQCIYDSKRHPGEKRLIHSSNILTPNSIFSMEGGTKLDGSFVFGQKDGVYYHSRKAREFTCWAYIKHDDGSDNFYKSLKTHDQGKKLYLGNQKDKENRTYIRLKQTIFPTGDWKDVFELFVHKNGEDKAVSYTWTNPDANRIGINLRWLQVGCSHEK
mgnify:CR=1 FL=1